MAILNQIWLNFPVSSLKEATEFYSSIGFTKNEKWSGENESMLVWPVDAYGNAIDRERACPINIMLLQHQHFDSYVPVSTHTRALTKGEASSTGQKIQTQVFACFSFDSIAAIDEICNKVAAAGGKVDVRPPLIHCEGNTEGWSDSEKKERAVMYVRAFTDLDGHILDACWAKEEIEQAPPAYSKAPTEVTEKVNNFSVS